MDGMGKGFVGYVGYGYVGFYLAMSCEGISYDIPTQRWNFNWGSFQAANNSLLV